MALSQTDYNDKIRSIVERVLEKEAQGQHRTDAVHYEVDSSRMVFVTEQAKQVLGLYHNEPELDHAMYEDDTVRGIISKLAFLCVEADVYSVLHDIDGHPDVSEFDWGAGTITVPDGYQKA